ncbi:hypothetical protein ACFQ0G_53775 [Streptomyces chiangmaiensis]|uniref:hypothetical protein n=1 Tax=Streptomyces chiangmaiensis TaxID=766497 RepID=UPI0031F0D55C
MAEPDQAYVTGLATQLEGRHASLLATAENDLAILRGRLALTVAFIHDPTHDHAARTALAKRLGLPEPAQEKTHG